MKLHQEPVFSKPFLKTLDVGRNACRSVTSAYTSIHAAAQHNDVEAAHADPFNQLLEFHHGTDR
jgi:hypothetical protein